MTPNFKKAKESIKESILQSSMSLTYEKGTLTDFEFNGSGIALSYLLADIMETIISKKPECAAYIGLACDYVKEGVLK